MPSCSEVRVPEPEWPLIIPCAAKKSLIFSRNWVTLLFSYVRKKKKGEKRRYNVQAYAQHTLSQSGRFWPKPRHWRRRRIHVSQRPSAFGRSSHF
jgi:hypothetical protein